MAKEQRPRVELTDPSRPPPPPLPPPADAGPVQQVNGGATSSSLDVPSEWPITIKLRKPIRDKHSNLTEIIEFREPTCADIIACGVPAAPSFDTGQMVFDGAKMTEMMSRLSGIPMPFMQQMSTIDWTTCSMRLMRFFLPDLTSLA